MGRAPCCSKAEDLNRGAWTAKEDKLLTEYIKSYGEGGWRSLPRKAGLKRCGKSCRLRWMNYLRPNIKRGNISPDEEDLIVRLHRLLGNRWALIAGRLPGRTDNEIKNYWNTRLGKKRGMSESAYPNTRHKAVQEKQSTPAADLQNRPDNLGSSEKHYVKSPGSKNDIVRTRAGKYSGTVAVPDRRNVNAGNSQECRQFFDGGPVAEHNIPTTVSTNIPEIHPQSVEMHSENPCTSFSDLIYQEFTGSSEKCLTAGHDSTFQCEMNLSKVSCRNGNFMMISSPCDSTSVLEEFCTSSLTIEPANDLDQMSSLPHDNNNPNVDHTVNCFTATADEQGMTEMYNNTLELVDWMHEEYLQNPASHVGDSRSENLWLKNYTQFAMNIISE